ncbi:FERM domain-containing protein 7-like [Scyliorhinus torazame]|uniref:FERM domain-containing protein 7-like n=1 Tax=Scyliorhinus torazame TaxID=75743 RepID=UPI003B5C0126
MVFWTNMLRNHGEQAILDMKLCNENRIIGDLVVQDLLGMSDHNMIEFFIKTMNEVIDSETRALNFNIGNYDDVRYLFAQQIKRDLVAGRLHCNDNSVALLLSHIIQAEVGDFNEEQDGTHLQSKIYIPNQERLIHKIMNFHQKLAGLTSAESETRLLDTARTLEMFGIRLHPANDGEGTQIDLAVLHMGILVFQGKTKINTFNWAKIRKLSFKKRHFFIKLHSNIFTASCKDSLEFLMASRNTCKHFWKTCVECHAFFRLPEEPRSKPKPILYSKGSCFRYSGRTQKQLAEYMSKGDFKKVPFERRSCTVQSEEDSSVTDLELGRQVKGLPPDLVDTGQSGDTLGKVWQRPAEMGRKESAVDIVFTSELERSRPEADPVLEPSSSSVYTSYASDSGTEAKKYPVQLQKSRQSFHGNRTRKDTDTDELTCGNSPEFTIRSQCFSDNFPELDVFVSQSRRVPRHISMDEEIVRPSGMARPISLPARNFLANHGLYQRAVMRGSYGNTLNAVKEEESQQDDSLQPSKRSHSQSDMKTLGLLHVPELTPMANYLPLGWRPNPNKLRPAHMLQRKDALQTTERYISSGTESSDSDSEIISPYFHPRLFGKALRSSALKGGRFSSVSLQSGEGASSDRNAAEGMSHLTIYTDFI